MTCLDSSILWACSIEVSRYNQGEYMSAAPQFITDNDGNRVAVILDLATYRQMIEDLEDLEDIRAYHDAKASIAAGEKPIPFDEVRAELEAKWEADKD